MGKSTRCGNSLSVVTQAIQSEIWSTPVTSYFYTSFFSPSLFSCFLGTHFNGGAFVIYHSRSLSCGLYDHHHLFQSFQKLLFYPYAFILALIRATELPLRRHHLFQTLHPYSSFSLYFHSKWRSQCAPISYSFTTERPYSSDNTIK